jgi:predicted DNA-binding protein (UPF0251 family)
VNHLDANTSNNAVENLEWCTQRHNLAHAKRLGRKPDNYWKGKRSPNAALSSETVEAIRAEYAAGGISLEGLGQRLGISKRTVGRIVARQSYV